MPRIRSSCARGLLKEPDSADKKSEEMDKDEDSPEVRAKRIARFLHQNAEFRRLRAQGEPSPLDEPVKTS